MQVVTLPAAAFLDERLKATDIHILGLIAAATNSGRQSYSFDEIASAAGITRRSAIRSTQRLEQCGWLSHQSLQDPETGGPGANAWQVLWQALPAGGAPSQHARQISTDVSAAAERPGS
jgi:hypothetical protein